MIYFFLGPPASGKDTQAKLLANDLHLPFISFGDQFRRIAQSDPEIAELLKRGALIPDNQVEKVYQKLHQNHPDNCVVDGALRTAAQVDYAIKLWGQSNFYVIILELADQLIKNRAEKRLTEKEQNRNDDRSSVVEDRIALYRSQADKTLTAIQQHGIHYITINGDYTIENLHQAIQKKIIAYDHPTKNT